MKFLGKSRKVAPENADPVAPSAEASSESPTPLKTAPTRTQFFDLSVLEQSVNKGNGNSAVHDTHSKNGTATSNMSGQLLTDVVRYALVNTRRKNSFAPFKKQPKVSNSDKPQGQKLTPVLDVSLVILAVLWLTLAEH
jgi:hypothetical protein